MKHPTAFTAAISIGILSLLILSGCSSNSMAERAAARQPADYKEDAPTYQPLIVHAANQEAPSAPAESPAEGEEKPATGDSEKGKEVFEQCSICHAIEAGEEKMGPPLMGLYKKEKLQNGKPVNDETVRAVINEGGNGMPGYDGAITAEELTNLLAYLRTI